MKINKLIIFNIILLVLLSVLPKKTIIQQEICLEKQKCTEMDRIEQISSRSLIEKRELVCEQVYEQVSGQVFDTENVVSKATTYSEELVEYIKKPYVEGFKEEAYYNKLDGDEIGKEIYTIGYGHRDSNIRKGQKITEIEADRLLRADLEGACQYVLKHCEYLGDLNQGELDALTDFTFNGGPGMLQKLTNHKTRSKEEIAKHFAAYTNGGVKGLVNRRNEEIKMFLGGV